MEDEFTLAHALVMTSSIILPIVITWIWEWYKGQGK